VFGLPDTGERRQGSTHQHGQNGGKRVSCLQPPPSTLYLWADFLLYLLDKRFGGSQKKARRFMEIILVVVIVVVVVVVVVTETTITLLLATLASDNSYAQ
jgi:hypothetical protein